MSDFAAMNAVWDDAWVPEGHTPARACGEAKLACQSRRKMGQFRGVKLDSLIGS